MVSLDKMKLKFEIKRKVQDILTKVLLTIFYGYLLKVCSCIIFHIALHYVGNQWHVI